MRGLALLLALSWFWILFYAVGPIDSAAQLAAGAAALAASCAGAALAGAVLVARGRRRRLAPLHLPVTREDPPRGAAP